MTRKENTGMHAWRSIGAALAALVLVVPGGDAGAQPLRRNLSSYFLLTMKRATLKNLRVGSPCNVGVNCGSPTPKSKCGVLALGRVTAVDGGQVVAHQTFLRKPGAQVWQLFRNDDSPLDNVTLVGPPPNPQTFDAPVIPGTCDDDCNPDYDGMKAACGFPSPFPSCDDGKPVKVVRGGDCPPYDTVPGNQQCDLPPGTYGSLQMNDGSRLNLQPGVYVLCMFKTGQATTTTADGTTIIIPDGAPSKNAVRASNGSLLGADCGDLRFLVDGETKVSFGRSGVVAAEVCAPQAKVSLGHNNILIGSFVADTVSADLNNFGRCCGGACSCYDVLAPTAVSVGSIVTATGECNVEAVTEVRVCGFTATVVSRAPGEVKFEVPALAAGACPVEFVSPVGTFLGSKTLTVS
jgi:hypothetical protein